MIDFNSMEELIKTAVEKGKNISDIVVEEQSVEIGKSAETLQQAMFENLKAMKEAIDGGLKPDVKSVSGLSGGDAFRLMEAVQGGKAIGGNILSKALVKAMATSEFNACMGRIVAAPTAGSCGIIPSALITFMEEYNIPESKIIAGLFTAAGIGMVVANRASISGAEGGCQAECGSASAMAAGALVEIMGGTPKMVGHACAIAIKNNLGLVCDPVAGLVEVPCIKRNAGGVANALVAAELALAGIKSVIPVDEVIDVMKSVGNLMTVSLKETAEGGLAASPTARRLTEEIFGGTRT